MSPKCRFFKIAIQGKSGIEYADKTNTAKGGRANADSGFLITTAIFETVVTIIAPTTIVEDLNSNWSFTNSVLLTDRIII